MCVYICIIQDVVTVKLNHINDLCTSLSSFWNPLSIWLPRVSTADSASKSSNKPLLSLIGSASELRRQIWQGSFTNPLIASQPRFLSAPLTWDFKTACQKYLCFIKPYFPYQKKENLGHNTCVVDLSSSGPGTSRSCWGPESLKYWWWMTLVCHAIPPHTNANNVHKNLCSESFWSI